MANDQSPREQVVHDIIRGLYEGRYRPGQRLVEANLTRAYSISRGPVREALNRLAATGVVTLTLQRGAQVSRLTRAEAIDILIVVEALIGIAARLAAVNIGLPRAARRLKGALARLTQFDPSSNAAEHAIARDSFYGVLTDISGNAELRRILPSIQVHLIRVQFREEMRATDRSRHADYKRIAEAVFKGNAAAAERAARVHIARAIRVLKNASPKSS